MLRSRSDLAWQISQTLYFSPTWPNKYQGNQLDLARCRRPDNRHLFSTNIFVQFEGQIINHKAGKSYRPCVPSPDLSARLHNKIFWKHFFLSGSLKMCPWEWELLREDPFGVRLRKLFSGCMAPWLYSQKKWGWIATGYIAKVSRLYSRIYLAI